MDWQLVFMIITSALTVFFAILVVEMKDLIRMIVSFAGMSISIGMLYWMLNAPIVAVFQILIYAGAVVTLLIATVMLTKGRET